MLPRQRATATGLQRCSADRSRSLHDFQRDHKTSEPFVWVRDLGDPDAWARECDLVRNQSRPALGKNASIFGSLALDMLEHLG